VRSTKPFSEFTEEEWQRLHEQVNNDDPEGFVPLSDREYWLEQQANLLEYEKEGLV